jgi:peptidoglycan hydrolase-like protein with peptidoglycan-binding domain
MAYAAGEDRSSFQAVGSWSEDVFGFAKATEANDWTDPVFYANWQVLGSEGKVRGAYHFFHPADSAAAQAQHFVSTVKAGGLAPGDILICDAEISSGIAGEEFGSVNGPRRSHVPLKSGQPLASTGGAVLQFLDTVQALAGPECPVLLYTDLSMAESVLGQCSGYPLFIAYYASSPPGVSTWRGWTFWQREAGGGQGGGDVDYFNGTAAQLMAWRASYLDSTWTETLVNNLPTLQMGAVDKPGAIRYVHRLQNDVAGYGRWNGLGKVTAIADDGNFGDGTKAAVEAVQRHAGLTVDGIAGRDTWTLLIA